ncbi:MAG: hypothetical protein Q9227_004195 [Pyrenula ochraceoflavens]
MNGGTSVSWAAAKAKSDRVNGYPSFSTRNEGFFQRSKRKLSASLPRFNNFAPNKDWRETEKLGRGRWAPRDNSKLGRLKTFLGNLIRKFRLLFILALLVTVITSAISMSPLRFWYRRSHSFGGGSKFVIILGANQGGGVMEWKGPREWAIERDSVKNKRKYATTWGYDLEIVDMSTKKRYAHEWRESWEKVDTIRNAMRKYPKAEWFWWLDLNTFIMEPKYSLQSHIFNRLGIYTYRDINHFNPLKMTHPLTDPFLDPLSLSPTGDNITSSIDLLLSQDCGGFNLGSFFVRRSTFTDRLLDIWWDPVLYEQKHMQWEHKEQDALEYLYEHQPWIRTRTAFLPQRMINSYPPGACGEKGDDPNVHYQERDRDFFVNMAGCEWGRDCWAEIYQYRELSNRLNRSRWERFKDSVRERWEGLRKAAKEDEQKDGDGDKDGEGKEKKKDDGK